MQLQANRTTASVIAFIKWWPIRSTLTTLYMQEHCGVFMSKDAGDSWQIIEEGLSMYGDDRAFGFPITVGNNGDLFLIPLESSEKRSMREGKLLVWSRRRGESKWEPIGDVVPDEQRHVSVLRDGMSVDTMDPYGLYIGTSSGEVFCSLDRGVTWATSTRPALSHLLCQALDCGGVKKAMPIIDCSVPSLINDCTGGKSHFNLEAETLEQALSLLQDTYPLLFSHSSIHRSRRHQVGCAVLLQ